MNRIYSHLAEVDLIGKLADLKLQQHQSALLLEALITLLAEKNILTPEEVVAKAQALDAGLLDDHLRHGNLP